MTTISTTRTTTAARQRMLAMQLDITDDLAARLDEVQQRLAWHWHHCFYWSEDATEPFALSDMFVCDDAQQLADELRHVWADVYREQKSRRTGFRPLAEIIQPVSA